MTSTIRRLAMVLVTVPVLASGCSAGDEPDPEAQETPQASESPSLTEAPSEPTPAPLPDKDGDGVPDETDTYPQNPLASVRQVIEIDCGGGFNFTIDRIKVDFSEAWRRPMPKSAFCEYWGSKLTPVSGVEQRIWDRDRRPSRYTIPIPYEQCLEHGTPWMKNEWPVSKQQVPEAEAALLLCPKHPDGAAIRSRIGEQAALSTELKDGRAFEDGNYRVGLNVKPGTYFTSDVENCYWERLDSAGEIIDNNFVPSALRVEATIADGDFSFRTEGCGLWRLVK